MDLTVNKTKFIAIIWLIELASLVIIWKTFQLDTPLNTCTLLEHTSGGVCQLGRIGAVFLMIWSVLFLIILTSVITNSKGFVVMGSIHAAILSVFFAMSLMLNPILLVRTMPYYMVQLSVIVLLTGQKETT
jgi:hypothetical protein